MTVDVDYCPVKSYDSTAFKSVIKYLENQGVSLTVPSDGEAFTLVRASVVVIGPINPTDEPNDTSIFLRIV